MVPYRIEKDSLGEVQVPSDCLWGAQTERSRHYFPLADVVMPWPVVQALVIIKKAACLANWQLGLLSVQKKEAIVSACNEILTGKWHDQFPLSVFQTGSGTQTNMNVNEVIANRAIQLLGGDLGSQSPIHPNDDVNKSQSSNDVFPTAMHIASVLEIENRLLPAVTQFKQGLEAKATQFQDIIKIGRTHLMDAVPLTLGQEFSGYASQIAHAIDVITHSLAHLRELALGATAVGTGLNCPAGFAQAAITHISDLTNISFVAAPNSFQALAAHEAIVSCSGALKTLATALFKIASDIRLMGSGPRAGLQELSLPENEPGSSIMPGKVNPTQCEALTMIAAQVFGCDATISFAASQGHFELNVFKPVIISNLLHAIHILTVGCNSFYNYCLKGLQANEEQLKKFTNNTLMIATALTPLLGYDKVAKIVQKAHLDGVTLKEAATSLGLLTQETFDATLNLQAIVHPQY